jgi:NAD(P)-dependent dehydrogenase (short-subunit alcohol dehydrogenase family)
MSSHDSPVALVTGANRGLGLETSRQLLARGLVVVLAGRREDELQRAIDGLDHQGRAVAVRMDLADPASLARAHQTVADRVGPVSVLVNNAAVLLAEQDAVLAIPREAYQATFDVNVFGAIEVCRLFAPAMATAGYGRIVNVSSGAGQLATMSTYAPAYAMSKTALNAFTRLLANTYERTGVLVNAVDPGWVRTDMGGSHAPRSVEEGADTIVWLATLPPGGPTGGFFRDRRAIAW